MAIHRERFMCQGRVKYESGTKHADMPRTSVRKRGRARGDGTVGTIAGSTRRTMVERSTDLILPESELCLSRMSSDEFGFRALGCVPVCGGDATKTLPRGGDDHMSRSPF